MKGKAKMKIFFSVTCVKAKENNKIYLQVKQLHPVLGNLEKVIGDQPYL